MDQMKKGNISGELESFIKQAHRNYPPKNSDKNLFFTVCDATAADGFYVPSRVFKGYHYMSNLFRKHNAFHEVANVAILVGLDNKEDIIAMGGMYGWSEERKEFWNNEIYHKFTTSYHPLKFSEIEYNKGGWNKSQFCSFYIKDIFKRVFLN